MFSVNKRIDTDECEVEDCFEQVRERNTGHRRAGGQMALPCDRTSDSGRRWRLCAVRPASLFVSNTELSLVIAADASDTGNQTLARYTKPFSLSSKLQLRILSKTLKLYSKKSAQMKLIYSLNFNTRSEGRLMNRSLYFSFSNTRDST